MAVVYAVMLESGFNKTDFGKGILGACFVNDLGTVMALALLFAPFTYRTAVFVGVCLAVLLLLPPITSRLIAWYGNRTAAIRTKWILLVLFGLGALALWAGSEAVLPAYRYLPESQFHVCLGNAGIRVEKDSVFGAVV